MSKAADPGMRLSPFITHHPSPGIRFAPWLLFLAFLAWGWQKQDFVRSVPNYGDILELTWALSWYSDALRQGLNPLHASTAFYPVGWDLTTYATGFLFLPVLLPLHRLGGAAFAYNVGVLLTFILAFAGMLALARRHMKLLGATIAAVLYTFWSFRWMQTIGHLNILLGSACLPWMIWLLERALDCRQRRSALWLALVGLIWAAAIISSMYFIWIGGLLLAGWLLGWRCGGRIAWRTAINRLAIPAAVALLLVSPILLAYWRASTAVGAGAYDLVEVNFWGASINALPLPSVSHPWLKFFSTAVYRGITFEQGTVNLGLLAVLTALGGTWVARKDRRWLPVFVIMPVALVLCLGLTLKWDNRSVQWEGLRPLNAVLWQLGHRIKPDIFKDAQPPAPFDAAISLPGLWLSTFVPLFERARVFARYAFVAALGIYLFVGLAITRLRAEWLRWPLAAALIFEVVPPPLASVPFPPPAHPAFTWLQDQPAGTVADLLAAHPDTLVLINRGETVWATRLHGKPAVGGASSVWPAPAAFLNEWLATHPHPFAGPTIAPLLRFYGTRYVLLHMTGEWETSVLEEAKQNREFRFLRCFDPPVGPSPWAYPICVLEVMPPPAPTFNLAPVSGWSGPEEWGVWAIGPESRVIWVATTTHPARLIVEAFPNCLPGRTQTLIIESDGRRLAEHTWTNCDPWSAVIEIPSAQTRLGGHELVLRPAYALPPAASDTRPLSVGFSRLEVRQD